MRMHDLRDPQLADKLFLIAALVLGVVGGIVLKATGLPAWVPAIFSAGVLLVYVLAVGLIGRLRLEPEGIGDNCYYLGFIFTLASLAWTLYEISGLAPNADRVAQIISGFGIALSSTIAGIALRVILLQFRPDIVARDREARIEMHQAVREFRTTLSQASGNLRGYTIEMQQSFAEHHQRLTAISEEAITGQRERLSRDAEQAGEALHKATREAIETTLKEVERMLSSAMERSSTVTMASARNAEKTLKGMATELTAAIESLTEQTSRLARSGSDAGKSLISSSGEVESASSRLVAALEKLAANSEAAGPGLGAAAERAAAEMRSASERYVAQLDKAAEGFSAEKLTDALRARDEGMAEAMGALARAASALEGLPARVETALQRIEEKQKAPEPAPLANGAASASDSAIPKLRDRPACLYGLDGKPLPEGPTVTGDDPTPPSSHEEPESEKRRRGLWWGR